MALRSYLPADHELKAKEIGSETTPAEFIDTLLRVTAELRRVLAPHGSICIELGDTYAGSGSGGEATPMYREGFDRGDGRKTMQQQDYGAPTMRNGGGPGWPLPKSRALIPQLYEIALAYGINPLTGSSSPAGQWRIRNVVTWARPNPPVGALGDKWRPATSDLIVACTSGKRYWDDLATRKEPITRPQRFLTPQRHYKGGIRQDQTFEDSPLQTEPGVRSHEGGAPLLDYWEIPPGGYTGSHYAVFPEELVVPCVKAMCPEKVCRTCGEPSRRIVEHERTVDSDSTDWAENANVGGSRIKSSHGGLAVHVTRETLGWTDCGHDTWRPGLVLDPFAGSGTTLSVATGHGHDAVGVDLDERNAVLAAERIGPFLFERASLTEP